MLRSVRASQRKFVNARFPLAGRLIKQTTADIVRNARTNLNVFNKEQILVGPSLGIVKVRSPVVSSSVYLSI